MYEVFNFSLRETVHQPVSLLEGETCWFSTKIISSVLLNHISQNSFPIQSLASQNL